MQGKGLIRFFIIALLLVCFYQLMFTYFAARTEKKAEKYAKEKVFPGGVDPLATFTGTETERAAFIDSINRLVAAEKRRYLDSVANEVILNILIDEYTYQEVKERQLSLGLDLQGGMSVVLQVSVEQLIKAMSGYSKDPTFLKALEAAKERQKNTQANFVDLFVEEFEKIDPGAQLAAIFATPENQDKITFSSTNEEVKQVIKEETAAAVRRTYNIMRSRIDEFGVSQPNILLQENTGRIIIELPGVTDTERARKLLQSTAKLEFWEVWENAEIIDFLVKANDVIREIEGLKSSGEQKDVAGETATQDTAIANLLGLTDTEKSPADSTTIASPDTANPLLFPTDTTKETDESKLYPLFGSNSPLKPATYQDENGQVALRPGPVIGYAYAQDREKVMKYLSYEEVRALFPPNIKFLWSARPVGNNLYELYAIKTQPNEERAPLEGDVIVDARQNFDNNGKPDIDMVMNSEGARIWRRLTKENIQRSIAIVMDDVVYSAPVVQSEIAGGRSQITGNFTISEAKDLASIIKSGKLPAPAKIIEEEIVGPSLGKESIRAGLISLVIGIVVVLLFMVFYYSSSGLIADIALLLNLFIIMGVLASFGASLTLPGMAGIVLTLGMAVDANVIINERIREELARGKGMRLAITDGYTASYSAIIDGNLTTLITGIILLFFGLGPVKGFATVLVIGIFSSLITAVLVTRMIIDSLLSRDKTIRFYTRMSEGLFKNVNFDFVGKRKMTYVISALTLLISIASFVFKGFELGVDFKGGRSYVVRFDQPVNTVDIATRLNDYFKGYPTVKTYGSSNQVKITTAFMIDSDEEKADSIVEATLFEGLKSFYQTEPTFEQFVKDYKLSSVKVGPTIADDIKQGAFTAAIVSIIAIFLYILFRFRRWQFGLGAIASTVHDAIFLLGTFSLLGGMLPFSTEIDQTFIAALLTVIGYSVNDTVVVFDRIREYLNLHPTKDLKTVTNMAINSTLSRTVMTSFTTLLVVVILMVFGGEVIRGFSFALFIGILVGTYSSIFVAAAVMIDTQKQNKAR
ncbi:MAG: protein translocase subunit SecDF [Chitinophagales bacterium]|nr:MAG: protein translocase subunit SecDF [Chitinophagales bacterium]